VNFIAFDAYETTRYLLAELRREGCETVALFAGPASLSCEADSARAFRDFRRENELPDAEKYLRHLRATKEEAFRAGVEFFSATSRTPSSRPAEHHERPGAGALAARRFGQQRYPFRFVRTGKLEPFGHEQRRSAYDAPAHGWVKSRAPSSGYIKSR
jgi:hypothetical protein